MSAPQNSSAPQIIAPLKAHIFDGEALAAWLAPHLPEAAQGLHIGQFQGGMSNPTYLLTTRSGRRLVLRKKPPGVLLPRAHAVDREYRVMRALGPTEVPVPEMIAYCDDPDVIGAEFFIMDYVEGRIIPDPAMGPVARADRPALAYALIDTLAALHLVDWRAAGLEGFGRPENYLGRQTIRWAAQYESAKPDLPDDFDYSDMDWLQGWLGEHADASHDASIVHGDYRLGNTVVDAAAPRVAAVLDWELSTIGHPLGDLAYTCLPYRLPQGIAGRIDPVEDAVPREDEIIARYCARTGRDGIPEWPVFLAFACFRYAAIVQGVAARAAKGNASSASADPLRDGARARAVAQIGADIARRMDRRKTEM
ncbi:MAG: phosphotransferase family protein [Paracoccaceae bacterium]